MLIETIKYYIQSANVNILYGSGLSRPYLAVLGDIERWLTELNEKRSIDGNQTKYSIVEASILKQYYETVIEPNLNPKGSDYEKTIKEYRQFLLTLNELINKRSNRLVGKQVNLFTTNIDTLMERASAGFGVELNDGFQGSITQVFDAGNFQKTVSKVSLHFQNVSELPVFNLLKMHGSINWQDDGDRIRNDMSLQQVMAIRKALDSIDSTNFISTRKTDPDTGEIMDKTLSEMLVEAEGKHISNKDVFSPFLESYHKLVMINPTKRKFRESVLDHHFYELMRQYSNNLLKFRK